MRTLKREARESNLSAVGWCHPEDPGTRVTMILQLFFMVPGDEGSGWGSFHRGMALTMKRQYSVYILTGHSRTLYVGVTNDIERRVSEHKLGLVPGFTSRYRVKQLVHVEWFSEVTQAIAREKQIKGWTRAKKIALIESENPKWSDLAEDV